MRAPLAASYFNMFWSDTSPVPPAIQAFFQETPFLHITSCAKSTASTDLRRTLYTPLTHNLTTPLDTGTIHQVTTTEGCRLFGQLLRGVLSAAHANPDTMPRLEEWTTAVATMAHTTQLFVTFQNGQPVASLQLMLDDQQTAGVYALSGSEDTLGTLLLFAQRHAYDMGARHLICPQKPHGGPLTPRHTRLFSHASAPYAAITYAPSAHALKTSA
jgi:hypothetical protein